IGNNQIGNLTIDPRSHVVYEVFNGIGSAADVPCASANLCAYHAVWVGVSRNGGRSFTDYPVHVSPDTAAGFDHQFVNVSIDRGGTVYVVYSDGHDVFLSASRTRGHTWSPPHRLNSAPSRTAIFPWSAAGGRGKLDVVWYGTNYRNGSRQADLFPASARWYVYFAQVRRAAGAHPQVVQVRATPVVHRGAVCHGGITCLGDRTLYDDFGVAINPRTGLASIVFSDDQYTHSRRQPSRPG